MTREGKPRVERPKVMNKEIAKREAGPKTEEEMKKIWEDLLKANTDPLVLIGNSIEEVEDTFSPRSIRMRNYGKQIIASVTYSIEGVHDPIIVIVNNRDEVVRAADRKLRENYLGLNRKAEGEASTATKEDYTK